MNPLGRHFGLMRAGDLICLDVNTGAVVGGNNVSKVESRLTVEGCLYLESIVYHGRVIGNSEHHLTSLQTRPANKAGFLIHSEIHKARPDVHAICHAHTDAGRAWSVFAKPLEMLNQDVCNFYGCLAVDSGYGGIVFAEEEGRRIAKAMGETSKVSRRKRVIALVHMMC